MLEQGVIHPLKSPWASPIMLVAKKDGSIQFYIDYCKLNSVTKMDVFSLPRVDESLDLLAQSKHFSLLDLSSGYCASTRTPSRTSFRPWKSLSF